MNCFDLNLAPSVTMSLVLTDDFESAARFNLAVDRRLAAIESVLWDAERGAWFDYNLMTHSKHFEFYPSNLAPVWAECYSKPAMGEKAVQYLKVCVRTGSRTVKKT